MEEEAQARECTRAAAAWEPARGVPQGAAGEVEEGQVRRRQERQTVEEGQVRSAREETQVSGAVEAGEVKKRRQTKGRHVDRECEPRQPRVGTPVREQEAQGMPVMQGRFQEEWARECAGEARGTGLVRLVPWHLL